MKKTRAQKGENYWIIRMDDIAFEVVKFTDEHTLIDTAYFEGGNYFTSQEEAEIIAEKFRKVLNGGEVIEPLKDDDKFATEMVFKTDYVIVPPKNHLIGSTLYTDRGVIVEFIDKSKN